MLIEFCGTPSSGKSSTIENLYRNGIYTSIRVIEESILNSPFDDSNFELGILWTIFDTYSEFTRIADEDLSENKNLIVFNRGLLDRIAFARLLGVEDKRYVELAYRAERWLRNSKQLQRFDIIFLFLTTYEKAVDRKLRFKLRGNSTFRIVNPKVISILNAIYLELYIELKDNLPIVLIDDLNNDLSLEQKASIVKQYINDNS